MRKLLLLFTSVIALGLFNLVQADTISDITDSDYKDLTYPVRDNALVILRQPVPDNSGDYTMTICNKQSHCRQTSMLSTERRYIGLFIEDMQPVLDFELNQKLTKEQWGQRQDKFRQMYADYMNMYDKIYGELKVVTPPEVKVNVTGVK